ncbi:MAG: cobalamin-dependent protein [Candidatus Fermentibacteraceae bacterium]|nr:cobalamin-dependent protein [Candidatus Fermentibacteraceae bacterium]
MHSDDLSPGDVIISRMDELVATALRKQYDNESDTWDPFGEPGYRKSLRDSRYHFSYLAESMKVNSPELFKDYVGWVKILFAGLDFPRTVPVTTLKCMMVSIREHLDERTVKEASRYFEAALEYLPNVSCTTASHIRSDTYLGKLATDYLTYLLNHDSSGAEEMILQALEDGTDLRDIYLKVLQPCQYELGRLWQISRITVEQEHYCTEVTGRIMSRICRGAINADPEKIGRRFVAAAIGGELHGTGIRMVTDFMEMAGWETLYLGANTPADGIVRACCNFDADLLGLSTTISFHIGDVKDLIRRVREAEPRNWLGIMVGGYPFNLDEKLWREVGADGFGRDADEAVRVAGKLTGIPGQSPPDRVS